MVCSFRSFFLFLLGSFFFSASALAGSEEDSSEPAYEIDLDLGEEINEVCAGCHGEYAEGGKGGVYPRIAGFPAAYLRQQIGLFKSDTRHNIPMKPYANDRELPDEDMYAVTAYIQSIQLQSQIPDFTPETTAYEKLLIAKQVLNIPRLEGDIKLGKKLFRKQCKMCHGRAGKGKKNTDTPPLSGQYSRYLKKQINAYKAKKRHHDNDEEDDSFDDFSEKELQAILAYLSITDDK